MNPMRLEEVNSGDDARTPHGIVIHDRRETPQPPAIRAFIWGGKIRPIPEIPYGRPRTYFRTNPTP